MKNSHKALRRILLIQALLLGGCVSTGESVLPVRGSFVDSDGYLFRACALRVLRGEVEEDAISIVGGDFEIIFVLSSSDREEIRVAGHCADAATTFMTVVKRLPRRRGEFIELGKIELVRKSR